jgi:hypothetical protein
MLRSRLAKRAGAAGLQMARPAGALQLARLNERQLAVTKTFQEFFA